MPHGHDHGHHHHHAPGHVTHGSGSILLDIGGDMGALIIHARPEQNELEIEISPGTGGARTHNQVHARQNWSGTSYSAVFPSVAAGEYVIWRDAGTPETSVTIRGGEITEHHWS
ncbi:MAG TPA: hypothetical protein VFV67_30825 [Actinophytocola sp.]|uniref:hypothetical protein n=1 Tax=Actinophytocola sp. TaxID=1872138 RepID=UPI002DBE31E1|nr:hypothetical protein [Actinophytocola sp.]HEU5475060.1 hypothetical protein [Actinophytocola sp.]